MAVEFQWPAADDIDWARSWQWFLSVLAAGLFGVYAGVQTLGLRFGRQYCATSPQPQACADAVVQWMGTYEVVAYAFGGVLLLAIAIWLHTEVLTDE
jgi:hypothetical protein